MSPGIRIFFDFINNLYNLLLAVELCKNIAHAKPKAYINKVFIIIMMLYTLPEHLPFGSYIGYAIVFIYILVMCYPNWKNIFKIAFFSLICIYIMPFVISIMYSIVLLDFNVVIDNLYYSHCKTIISIALVYILYILYINGKRMKRLDTGYYHMFSVVILSITLILSYLTLYICQTQELKSPVIPVLFSSFFILIAVCVNIYRHFIELIEENMHAQIMLEQNKMTEDYSNQIETNLKELHSLRHDIRNHLITIDGYASQKRFDSIHDYIARITDNYTDVPLFDTTSDVVSALLNAKHQVAQKQGIDFSIDWNFPYIHIEDFSVITILGNLIDNAITAAGKCENGRITLEMLQSGSYLEIHMKNNHKEVIHEKHGEFQSTKEDSRSLHGLGIKNIRSTVEQLNGQIDIHYTDEIFEVNILVPNY